MFQFETKVFPIELCYSGESGDHLPKRVGAEAVERDIKRDLARLSADREDRPRP